MIQNSYLERKRETHKEIRERKWNFPEVKKHSEINAVKN